MPSSPEWRRSSSGPCDRQKGRRRGPASLAVSAAQESCRAPSRLCCRPILGSRGTKGTGWQWEICTGHTRRVLSRGGPWRRSSLGCSQCLDPPADRRNALHDRAGEKAQGKHEARGVNEKQQTILAAGEDVARNVTNPAIGAEFHVPEERMDQEEKQKKRGGEFRELLAEGNAGDA